MGGKEEINDLAIYFHPEKMNPNSRKEVTNVKIVLYIVATV